MGEKEQEEEKCEKYQPTCTTCDRNSYQVLHGWL